MTAAVEQFPYVPRNPALGDASLAPMLPLTLIGATGVETCGLVDSGAAVNVLPYSLGVQLGFDWNKQTSSVELSGNLASVEARIAVVSAVLGDFAPHTPRIRVGQNRRSVANLRAGELLFGVRRLFLSRTRFIRGTTQTFTVTLSVWEGFNLACEYC